MSGTNSIFLANGVFGDSPGYNPGKPAKHGTRPNGAHGTFVSRHGSHLPNVPCAPLGRGLLATPDSRVSPFAITAYPVGDEKSIVSLIVEMIEPYQGRVYDPAMGSGGFHSVRPKGASGDSPGHRPGNHPTTWRLAAMNMAKSLPRQSETATGGLPRHSATTPGIDFDFGKEPADTFTRDQHPDRSSPRQSTAATSADFVMANPPFNIKEWWDGKLEGDARWKYGTPPQGNANFAWVQHMLHHLAPNGSMALLLANGSMSSNSSGEGEIRRAFRN